MKHAGRPGNDAPDAIYDCTIRLQHRYRRLEMMRDYDLLTESFYADPYPVLSQMRRDDPCWFDHRLGAYILTRYNDVKRVLQDEDFSARRVAQFGRSAPPHLREKIEFYVGQLERWLLFIDPPSHTPLRARLLRAFGPSLLPAIAEAAAVAVERSLDEIDGQAAPDIIAHYAYPVPTTVLARVLGITDGDIERFKQWTTDIFTLVGAGVADEAAVELGYRGITELRDYVLALLAQKRETPTADVLSALANPASAAEEQVQDEDIVGLFMSLIVAGHETSTNLIGNALDAIMANVECRRWVLGRPTPPEGAVDELIRFDGPVLSMVRRAKRDILVGGHLIRKNECLFSMLSAANRDPRHFAHPDRLDFDRPNPDHLGLGIGIHRCVGGAMARTVVGHAVWQFMHRFPDAVIAPGGARLRNLSFRGFASLPVSLRGTSVTGDTAPVDAMIRAAS